MAMKLSFDWKGLPALIAKGGGAAPFIATVNVTLVILLAYHAALLSWRLAPAVESELPPAAQIVATPSQRAASAGGGWNIARWHLFGEERKSAAPAPVAQQEIPKTTLKLTLRGVFVSDSGGGAIIAEANGKERFYAVNSRLSGGVVLKEVHATHVVLMRNNRLETLELPKRSLAAGKSSTSARQASSRRSTGRPLNLRQYRKELLREPQRLTDAIKMSPKSEKGRFIGYEVRPGRDRALFDRVGLIAGDIVTAVNGIQLDTPAKGLNVLRSLQTANSVRLDIKRNGRSQSFDVSIE